MDASRASVKLELAAEAVRRFGKLKIRVMGDSMFPAVRPGDVLTVVRQPLGRFRTGDIALAARRSDHGTEFVAHRVVRRQGRQLITRGDSLPHPDAPWEEHEILGRVAVVSREGRVVDTALTPGTRAAAWVARRWPLPVRVMLRFARSRV